MFNERLFRSKVVLNGLTLAETAARMDINEATMQRKLKNNGSFTRSEIHKLVDILNLTTDDVMDIFFAVKLE